MIMTMNFKANKHLPKVLLLAGLLLILLWLGVKGWRVTQAARSLLATQAEVETLLEGKVLDADPEALEALVLDVRQDIVTIRDEVGFLVPLAPYFGWAPRVGPVLVEGPAFLEMADAGTEAAVYAVRGLKPALILLQQAEGDELIPRVLPIVEEAGPELAAANRALERVVAARAEIDDVEALPWRVRSLLEQMDDKLYLVKMVPLLQAMPKLLGSGGTRTYLVLAQNEDEIRATGGFLTGVGLLTVNGGEIGTLQFFDSYEADAVGAGGALSKPYEPPPEPLTQLMGLTLFLFRDSNYWPDFPTSAEQAVALYRYGQDAPPIDGVIALDQQFIALLLRASGEPVTVPELAITVSAGNVIEQMRRAWAEPSTEDDPWSRDRKDFLGPLAEALKTRLLTEFNTLDPLFFAETLYQALAQKHLQLYMRDPALAAIMDAQNWDGRVEVEERMDLLLPVDTNVGYNKVGALIDTTLSYEVALNPEGGGEATATLHYAHGGNPKESCRQGEVAMSRLQPAYEEMVHDCFWNYLRLYVPAGSRLLESSQHPTPPGTFSYSAGWTGSGKVMEEGGDDYTVLGNFFLLPPGETITSVFRYRLPQVVQEEAGGHVYRLRLLRQAGANPRTATIRITLPEGARLLQATPAPATQTGQTLTFEQTITRDTELTIIYDGN